MMWRVFPEDKPHTALRFRVIFKCKMTIQVTPVVYDCLMSKMEEYKSGNKCRISHLFRKGLQLNIKKMDQISIVIAPK